MKYLVCLCLLIIWISGFGQKQNLDLDALHNWPTVEGGGLSPDGRYAYYHVTVINSFILIKNVLVLKSLDNNWSIQIDKAEIVGFSRHQGRFVTLRLPGDSIVKIELGTSHFEYIAKVKDVECFSDWIAYKSKDNDSLYIHNLENGDKIVLPAIQNFYISRKNSAIVAQSISDHLISKMLWINPKKHYIKSFYSGNRITQLIWDKNEKRVALLGGPAQKRFIYYHKIGSEHSYKVLSDTSQQIDSSYIIESIDRFSTNGNYLLFKISSSDITSTSQDEENNSILSYKEMDLTFAKNRTTSIQKLQLRSLNLKNGNIQLVERANDYAASDNGEYIMVEHWNNGYEWQKVAAQNIVFHLVRLEDGKQIKFDSAAAFWFSPSGKSLLYFDKFKNSYETYDFATGKTGNIPILANKENILARIEIGENWKFPLGVLGWANRGLTAIVNSRDGLWQLDMTGHKSPIHLTQNGSGLDSIIYRPIDNSTLNSKDGDSITLIGFNPNTKENGFYRCILGHSMKPLCLSKGPWTIWIPDFEGGPPIKSENSNLFIVRRMTAESSPNFLVTSDFKTFRNVSDIHPENNYNWLTTALIHWTSLDSTPLTGVLYKPANFDYTKRYPILFYYYEKLSDNYHIFLKPNTAHGPMNIPYMVSKGFLVFTPDIEYRIGYPGQSAYNAVVSAARFLSRLPYVDSLHMGIQGHSWGGFETNYIVTHSNLFTAACSGSGMSDMIMEYSSIRYNRVNQMYVEFSQCRIGKSIWQGQDLYIKNSPIFYIDKISTPLLIMHNNDDDAVDVRQSIAMFTAMRREDKPCWLLQYKGEGHILMKEENRIDYTEKILEFFNYYLKGKEKPDWMK